MRGSVGGTMEDSMSQANINSSLHYANNEIGDNSRLPLAANDNTDEHEPGVATIN